MWEQVDRLKKEICELLVEKVKESMNYEESKKRSELEKELQENKALVERAKRSKDQLKEYYAERKKERMKSGTIASPEEFEKTKKEYFE